MSTPVYGPGIEIAGRITPEFAQILTPEAMAFVAKLQRAFGGRRDELLGRRAQRQAEFDAGKLPDFLPGTRAVREGDWTCAPVGADITDRRVEITGPVDRKMIVNALNSGAQVFMADFEDANTPRWDNNIQGHINLRDAIRRRIDFVSPEGKTYALKDKVATLFVRPRGWHLPEKHVKIDGQARFRRHLRLRALFLPQRQGTGRAGQRSVLLPAQAREPSRSPVVERHLRDGAAGARHSRRAP